MNTNINANLLESRSDELERLVLEEVHKRRRSRSSISAMVLPAGSGFLSIELAKLGCAVTGVDTSSYEQELTGRTLASGVTDQFRFVPGSLDSLPEEIPGAPFDIIYLRRGLCSVPYEEARQIVRRLLLNLKIGGKIYVSVLGLHSELGYQYPGAEEMIQNRFCQLDDAMAQKYGINHDVCLYTERNLFMLLLEAGGSVLRTFTTTHCNVKGVAVRV